MGAALGGLAGVRSTGSVDGKIAGATVGSIVGGWIGGVATTQLASQNALEVIVQTADGRAVVVVQTVAEADNLSIGQKVFVVNVRGNTRVVKVSI
jgi:outer membrane lipoprotein SlyB